MININLDETVKKLRTILKFRNFAKKFKFQDSDEGKFVLIEFNSIWSSKIPYLYLLSELSNKYNSSIISYTNLREFDLINYFKYFFVKLSLFNSYPYYKLLNVKKFIHFLKLSKKQRKIIDFEYLKIIKNLKNKKDIEKIKIKGILIGDLIYDSYLKKTLQPTISLKDKNFKSFLFENIKQFFYWYQFIDQNVKAIVVSHTVYTSAIPLRICVSRNIESFQITDQQLHRISIKNLMAYTQFKYYKKTFKKIDKLQKRKNLLLAKKRLDLRLSGKIGVDMNYSLKSAYNKNLLKHRQLVKSNRLKVLIATHCFFDSPHSYGFNLFSDFYEWLNFLGKLSIETNYDWYIKTHPDFLPGNIMIIKSIIKKYPKIKLLKANISHKQLIQEGIDVALTVYGTIGCEYPLFKKLVINASQNNPHINYDFNLHPKNINSYKNMIMNLPKLKKKINFLKKDIYEFYYMHKIYNYDNFFSIQNQKLRKNNSQFIILEWLQNKKINILDKKIKIKIKNFVNSRKDFWINL